MALSISQILAASFPAVMAEKRKPTNQWAESAFLREAERQGAIKKVSLGAVIEAQLDYRRNAGAAVLASDLQPMSMTKTEVLTAASYAIASVSVPILWSKEDEAKNPTENQKIDLVDSLINNALDSHDDLLEQTLFTGVNGLLGLDTLISDTGVNTIGGIDASVETWWKNKFATYVDETDIESAMTTVWNACAKGSGSSMVPRFLVSDGTTQSIFEGTQQPQQRYVDSDDMKAGFKTIAFKTSRYVFSQYGGTRVYFLNPKSYQIRASKQYFRSKGAEQEIDNGNGFRVFVYSALQAVTDNRSRLGSAHL